MDQFDTYHLWQHFHEMQLGTPTSTPSSDASQPTSLSSLSSPFLMPSLPVRPVEMPQSRSPDPLTVKETDLQRRCLGTLTDALRAVICYAHSSYKVPISFQVKRFDRAHGQVWVKVSPEEVPEGFDLKYLLQHIKFYENIPRYAELLNMDDYKLRGTCQYFLDLQSKASSAKSEDPSGEITRVRETISRSSKWVHDMMNVGITDRDVVHQLQEAQTRLSQLSGAVEKFCTFQHNQSEVMKMTNEWFPEKKQRAARSIHQQIQHLLDDPEVVKYMLQVVGPRLGVIPFQFTPPTPGTLLT